MKDLFSTLEHYGADCDDVRLFDEDDPNLLPYASLVAARNTDRKTFAALSGVYERQSSPLVFLVNGEEIRDDDHFRLIRRCVALRGDAPYMGVVRPGQLTIHRISLDEKGYDASRLNNLSKKAPRTIFPFLANFRPGITSHSKWISRIVLNLLRDAIRDLLRHEVTNEDAISLTGRALFLRFLGDRDLLPSALGPPEHFFNDASHAELASHWLDDTFNGDLLPLPKAIFSKLSQAALHPLSNILYRAEGSQLHLGWQEKWNYLDFAHIPVGVLSETYEHYMREYDQERQRKEGSFYTPRVIADLMVSASFHALRRENKSATAVVLDPAAGAGVFLVSAFRRLVMERWAQDNKRPDTRVLREILYNQIVGFDINEAALRFAALGLYLISIELDPEPEPVEKLRFNQNLREVVLHNLSGGEDRNLGSLGKAVSVEHAGRYDLVIGNPPWASSTKLPNWATVSDIVKKIAKDRIAQDNLPPLLPNEVLDLPFVWRAMEWAKPGGQIAFALHGRLLFQQADGMDQARATLFRAFDVSGVINGAELRQTRVWPEVSAPFCLLFARNQLPPPGAAFRFVSPHLEVGLNDAGVMRIDASSAEMVTPDQIVERPEILKILFRGTMLDLEIFDRILMKKLVPLEQYWKKRFGPYSKGDARAGNGYQRLGKSSRIRKNGDGKPGASAAYLTGLKELTATAFEKILVNVDQLPKFDQDRIHDPRPRSLFKSPLLLVRESPSAFSSRILLAISESDIVFNKSYQGYSACGDVQGNQLVRYLALVLGSNPAIWYSLITSGRFGVEREVIESKNIDNLPIVPFESLSPKLIEQINPLFDAVVKENTPENWAKVDDWATALYGLDEQDLGVIKDTLRFNLPFAGNKKAAQIPPTKAELTVFCNTLQNELTPWAKREEMIVDLQQKRLPVACPWQVIRICTTTAMGNGECSILKDDWPKVLEIADKLASTEVIFPDPDTNSLWVARLNQARYWSNSQARLVARRIVWEHLDILFGKEFS